MFDKRGDDCISVNLQVFAGMKAAQLFAGAVLDESESQVGERCRQGHGAVGPGGSEDVVA